MKIIENAQTFGLKRVISYMDKNPEENIPKIIKWLEKTGGVEAQTAAVKKAIADRDGNWYKLVMSLWSDIDNDVRKTIFENFIVNATIVGGKRREKAMEKSGCNVPWAILMDPTSACNLQCTGCWAAEYGNKLNMNLDELDDIEEIVASFRQAQAMRAVERVRSFAVEKGLDGMTMEDVDEEIRRTRNS